MLVKCPNCGAVTTVNGLGRKPLDIPVTNIYNSLQRHHSVSLAAIELGCSRAYIYKVLKINGITPEKAIGKTPGS